MAISPDSAGFVATSRRSWRRPECLLAGLALFMLAVLSRALPAFAGGPHWTGGTKATEKAWHFKKSLSIDQAVQTAGLKMAADFCTAAVVINGQTVLTAEP